MWAYLALYKPWKEGRPIAAAIFLDEPARLVDALREIEQQVDDLEAAETPPSATGSGDGGHASRYAPKPSTGPNAPRRK